MMLTPNESRNLRPKGTNNAQSSALPWDTIRVIAVTGSHPLGASMESTTILFPRFVSTYSASYAASLDPAAICEPPSRYRAWHLPVTSSTRK